MKKDLIFTFVDKYGIYSNEEEFSNKKERLIIIKTLDLRRTKDVCDFFDTGNAIDPNR